MVQHATQNAPEPANREDKLKEKKERFTWWQTLIILVATLVLCVSAGLFVSSKYFWNKNDPQLKKQLDYAKAQVDKKPNDPAKRVDYGYAYFLNGENDKAIEQYKLAINLDKKDYTAYFNLGIAYNQENRFDDTIKMANKATDLAPKDYKAYLLKGMAYRKNKMYKESIKALNKANDLSPGNTDILCEIGRVAEDQGDKKNAEQIYKDTLKYDPNYKPALEGLKRVSKNGN